MIAQWIKVPSKTPTGLLSTTKAPLSFVPSSGNCYQAHVPSVVGGTQYQCRRGYQYRSTEQRPDILLSTTDNYKNTNEPLDIEILSHLMGSPI